MNKSENNSNNIIDIDIKNTSNSIKINSCENFILELQNYVNNTTLDTSKYLDKNKPSTSTNKPTNITKVKFVESTTINNPTELYNFYKQKADNNKLPNKKQTAELTNISESTVYRYNDILKQEKKIKTIGNSLYLINESEV